MSKICESESYHETMAYNLYDVLTLENGRMKRPSSGEGEGRLFGTKLDSKVN